MEPIYKDHEFEAAKLRYEDQVEVSRFLRTIELKVMSGLVTVQLLLGAWIYTHPPSGIWMRISFLTLDAGFAVLAGSLLWNFNRRRVEIVGTIKNLNEALGYEQEGVYLADKAINSPSVTRLLYGWYIFGIGLTFIGFCSVLFAASGTADTTAATAPDAKAVSSVDGGVAP